MGFFLTHRIKAQNFRGKFRSIFREKIRSSKKLFRAKFTLQTCHLKKIEPLKRPLFRKTPFLVLLYTLWGVSPPFPRTLVVRQGYSLLTLMGVGQNKEAAKKGGQDEDQILSPTSDPFSVCNQVSTGNSY